MTEASLDGRVAIVTGAGQGLGRAEALALAREGARVVVNDLGVSLNGAPDASRADVVVEEIAAFGGEAIAHYGDISDWQTAHAVVDAAVSSFGRLDVVVNNAGILRDRMLFNMEPNDWDDVVRVHLRGHFCMSRWTTTYWRDIAKAQHGPVYGRLINTASEAALSGSPGQPNYAASKAGIIALTLAVARGCARYGVLANAICPRANTRMTSTSDAGQDDPFAPERVAPLVGYLASPAASRVSGQVFVVYGRLLAVLGQPRVEARFEAPPEQWTQGAVDDLLTPFFDGREPVTDGIYAQDVAALGGEAWSSRDR